MRYIGIILSLLLLCGRSSYAQSVAVSVNLMDYVNFGTLNIGASYSASQHWSAEVEVRCNPWTFNKGVSGKQFQTRLQSYSAGARYWIWHTYSGWWMKGKLQYQEYNRGGLIKALTEEGDRGGIGASAGYTYMLHPNLNIEFGLGFWTGFKKYTAYSCPSCGLTENSGVKAFILPDNIIVALSYVF